MFKKSIINKRVIWPEIALHLRVFYPYDWQQENTDGNPSNIKFRAEKVVNDSSSLFLLVGGEKYDKPLTDEYISDATNSKSLQESTKEMGTFLCSEPIKVWKADGAWMLHKRPFKDGVVSYRATYLIYYFEYCYSIVFGAIANSENLSKKLYQDNDELFYDLVMKTKFKWSKGS